MSEHAEIVYELSDAKLREIVTEAATKAVQSFMESHECKWFDETQAKRVHAFNRACDEHSISEGDIMVMVYSAKTAHGFFKDLGKKAFYTVGISVILLLAYLFGPDAIKNWLKQ